MRDSPRECLLGPVTLGYQFWSNGIRFPLFKIIFVISFLYKHIWTWFRFIHSVVHGAIPWFGQEWFDFSIRAKTDSIRDARNGSFRLLSKVVIVENVRRVDFSHYRNSFPRFSCGNILESFLPIGKKGKQTKVINKNHNGNLTWSAQCFSRKWKQN